MRTLLDRTLILLAVIGLVFAPPVVGGYSSLRQAESAYLALDDLTATYAFERAATLLPWRPDLWDQAGVTRFRIKDFKGAIDMLEIAKSHGALSDVGWDVLGIAYLEKGDAQAAVENWQAGLAAFPSYAKYHSHLLFVYREQGDVQAEREALESWVASEGRTDAAAHYRLGSLLVLSDQERALDEYLLAASFDPEYDPAIQTLRSALNLASLESDESRKMVTIGRGLGLVEEWGLAEQAFRRAVAADGENAEAWAWLGEAGQQLGRDGRYELEMALKYGRENPIVRSLRGIYWTRQERGPQALAEYLLAAEYEPDNPAWRVSAGEAYVRVGDMQSALESYMQATEMEPGDPVYWRLLANYCAQYGLFIDEVGLPAARQAIALSPGNLHSLDTLGWLLLVSERYEEARYQFGRALEIDPRFAPALLHDGIAAYQLGDWQAARDRWLQASTLDPVGSEGKQAQMLLDQYFP